MSDSKILSALLPILQKLSEEERKQTIPPSPASSSSPAPISPDIQAQFESWFKEKYGSEFNHDTFNKFIQWNKNPPEILKTLDESLTFMERTMGGPDKVPQHIRSKFAHRAYLKIKGDLNDDTDDVTLDTFSPPSEVAKRSAEEITPPTSTDPIVPSTSDPAASPPPPPEKKQKTTTPSPAASITDAILNIVNN